MRLKYIKAIFYRIQRRLRHPRSIPSYFMWRWRQFRGWTPPGKMILYDTKK